MNFSPPFGYLYIPEYSQIAAHWRALLAWDSRVDIWLVNVARQFGAMGAEPIIVLLLWPLVACVAKVVRYLREAEAACATGAAPE